MKREEKPGEDKKELEEEVEEEENDNNEDDLEGPKIKSTDVTIR